MKKTPANNRDITWDPVHLIYRLHGSLPKEVLHKLGQSYEREMAELEFNFGNVKKLTPEESARCNEAKNLLSEKFQAEYDRLLDTVDSGPMFLSDHQAKRIIIDSWLYLEKKHQLEVFAISVMSNHVHVLLAHEDYYGQTVFKKLLREHKQFTAYKINQLQGAPGRTVWARKAFDRDVRRGAFSSVLWYILNNPVKAKLTDDPIGWQGNYARPGLVEV